MINFPVGDTVAKHLLDVLGVLKVLGHHSIQKINVLNHRVSPSGRKMTLEIPRAVPPEVQDEFNCLVQSYLFQKYALVVVDIKHSPSAGAFKGNVLVKIEGPLDVPNLTPIDEQVLVQVTDDVVKVADQP